MAENGRTHWLMRRIAEEQVPRSSIDLWPRIEARSAPAPRGLFRSRVLKPVVRVALAGAIVVLLVGALAVVPGVRAFAEDMILRMGIALVETDLPSDGAQSVGLEATRIAVVPPSLTVEEARQQIGFEVRLPTWLPASFAHTTVSIFEPTVPGNEGYGTKITIAYSHGAARGPGEGVLFMHASEGLLSAPPVLPRSEEQTVTVRGQSGAYVRGGWQGDGTGDANISMSGLLWNAQADDAYLTWVEDGVTYLLEAHTLGLEIDDLLRIAEAME